MSNLIIKFKHYELSIPTDKSILILTTPRTGSNALCSVLEKKTGLPNLAEIFHPDSPLGIQEWVDKHQDRATIIKLFPDHVIDPMHYNKLLKNSFVIGLYRQDIVAQILSYVIANKTNTYSSDAKNLQLHRPAVEVSVPEFVTCGKMIVNQREEYLKNKDKFDIKLCYEDIVDDLALCKDHVKLPKIANYDRVRNNLEDLLYD